MEIITSQLISQITNQILDRIPDQIPDQILADQSLVPNPLFWLALSLVLVAVSLTVLLATALPALWQLAKTAKSAEKLFETLNQELPPTLEIIRLTGLEVNELTTEVNGGVQSAAEAIKQVDQSILVAKNQAQKFQTKARGLARGLKAAWQVWGSSLSSQQKSPQTSEKSPATKSTAFPENPSQTSLENLDTGADGSLVQPFPRKIVPPPVPPIDSPGEQLIKKQEDTAKNLDQTHAEVLNSEVAKSRTGK